MNLNNIKILLQDISEFEILEIINNSEKHMGHAGYRRSVPISNGLVKRISSIEHATHIPNAGSIPVSNILIKC